GTYYAEPLLTLLVLLGIAYVFRRGRQNLLLVALIPALCVLAKPSGILVGPLLGCYLLSKRRELAPTAAALLGSFVGLTLFAGYDVLRFGSPTISGQPWQFGIGGFGEGLAGLLVSPARGLFWFCPPVLAAVV